MIKIIQIFLMLYLAPNIVLAADELAGVIQNPFKVPNFLNHTTPDVLSENIEPTGQELNLRAILLDGKASLVQVGDELIGVGEIVQGYKLISVQGDSAIFIKQGKQIRISVHAEKDGQHNE